MNEDTLTCRDGITNSVFIEDWWCGSIKPNDSICNQFTCSDSLEYRSVACGENKVGLINEVRTFYCNTNSYSGWTTSSNNCTDAPPTCVGTSETQTLACDAGYQGAIQETRSFSCATSYSVGVWSPWIKTSNSCVKTLTNVTNMDSPISPISKIKPPEQNKPKLEQDMKIERMQGTKLEEVNSPKAQETIMNVMPELIPLPKIEIPKVEKPKEKEKITPKKVEPAIKLKVPKKQEIKVRKKEEKKEVKKVTPKVPKGKSLVPGFGLTMSLDLLNYGTDMQQIQLNDILNLTQEQDYARQQNFLNDIISQDYVDDAFSSIADFRWRSLLYDNPLQQDAFDY